MPYEKKGIRFGQPWLSWEGLPCFIHLGHWDLSARHFLACLVLVSGPRGACVRQPGSCGYHIACCHQRVND